MKTDRRRVKISWLETWCVGRAAIDSLLFVVFLVLVFKNLFFIEFLTL